MYIEDYVKGNSYIFDINKNGIIDGNVNINNIEKPGLYNKYHFNKSVTTPFDFTFSNITNAQYNINNWLFPLNSENNHNNGRILSNNNYFAFKLDYDKFLEKSIDLEKCPRVFDIYGITADKNFTIFDINTSKSLLTPQIRGNFSSEQPNNLKLMAGVDDVDKSINNIDVSNYYLCKNNYKNTTIDLSNITLNIDDTYELTHGSTLIDNNCYIGPNGSQLPKVVRDPININSKVILLTGKGMKYKINNSYAALLKDKFSFELYFNLKEYTGPVYYSNNREDFYSDNSIYKYKHYIYSQANSQNYGFQVYVYDGDIYVYVKQDSILLFNFTHFSNTDKIKYNQWYHFAFTRDIHKVNIFLNGKKFTYNTIHNNIRYDGPGNPNELGLYITSQASTAHPNFYTVGVIGASNYESVDYNHTTDFLRIWTHNELNTTDAGLDHIKSLYGYISDFKAYDGYVIYESDFIPTQRNCLLKLDIHKYIDTNKYYSYNDRNIHVCLKEYNTWQAGHPRPATCINGIPTKTLYLIKNIEYTFICDDSSNNGAIFTITNPVPHIHTVGTSNGYTTSTAPNVIIQTWNSSNRRVVWTPTTTGIYYYISTILKPFPHDTTFTYYNPLDTIPPNDNTLYTKAGIIEVVDEEPVLDYIICSSNNKTNITIGSNVSVSSEKFKQHDNSLYFIKDELSMKLDNNIEGFKTDINSIQFYANIKIPDSKDVTTSDSDITLFSQAGSVSLALDLGDSLVNNILQTGNTINLPSEPGTKSIKMGYPITSSPPYEY